MNAQMDKVLNHNDKVERLVLADWLEENGRLDWEYQSMRELGFDPTSHTDRAVYRDYCLDNGRVPDWEK